MEHLDLPLGKLTKDQVNTYNLQYLSILEFIEKYHPGLKRETIGNWMQKNKIHFFKPGRERFVVLTRQTLNITPNKHKNRNT